MGTFAGDKSRPTARMSRSASCRSVPSQNLEADLDAVFADYGEDSEQMRDAQQFADALAQILEDQLAAGGLGGDVDAHPACRGPCYPCSSRRIDRG